MSRLPRPTIDERLAAGKAAGEALIDKCLADRPDVDKELSDKIRDGARNARSVVLDTMYVFIFRCAKLGVDPKIAEEVARVALAAALAEMQLRHEMREE